jgi:hypothetical protein
MDNANNETREIDYSINKFEDDDTSLDFNADENSEFNEDDSADEDDEVEVNIYLYAQSKKRRYFKA